MPKNTLDIIGVFRKDPEKCVEEYIESKNTNKNFEIPQNEDEIPYEPKIFFTEMLIHYKDMKQLQKKMKDQQFHQNRANKMRGAILARDCHDLRKQFLNVNEFLKDCFEKKMIALKISRAEEEKHKKYRNQIKNARATLQTFTQFRRVLQNTLKAYEPYETVILQVVEQSDLYTSPVDCMTRSDALMLAQCDIDDMIQNTMRKIKEMQKELVKITEYAALKVLGFKTTLTEINRSFNSARNECLYWERKMSAAKTALSVHNFQNLVVKGALYQLYHLLCLRKNEAPTIILTNTEPICQYIKEETDILFSVIKTFENEGRIEKRTNIISC